MKGKEATERMRQWGKVFAIALVWSVTAISVVGILSYTVTRFAGSGDGVELDVELKRDNVRVRAAVNSDKGKVRTGDPEKKALPRPNQPVE